MRPVKVLSLPAIFVGLAAFIKYDPLPSTGIEEAFTSLELRLDAVLMGSSLLPTVLAMSFLSMDALIDD